MTLPSTQTTVLIIPGLRDHVADHWQTHLASRLPRVRSVALLETDKLSLDARVEAIQRELEQIEGPVILVAHSAGVLMVAHWAAKYQRPIKGALLAAAPDLEASWPDSYPQPETLRSHGWAPLPRQPLPFPSILAASTNDYLAGFEAAATMASDWNAQLVNLGEVGHLNPASGYGDWPQADEFIRQLDAQ
ncbi:RBBP9/YdeN family alpha/beta hydrolase [Marinobacterium rhizophilum]|uniref:Alpha/beta hydrolase n=1 Tax=Marinobacterium rhizophilum TaxID=420402 RepID=A0ABY5HM91_9GAMM|nr:alpha/beta fold hydrolase [Marinobacterium rhizophilum]UTW12377.1 alpha/beta hydrolase [Marinobacterium rhizophilum]